MWELAKPLYGLRTDYETRYASIIDFVVLRFGWVLFGGGGLVNRILRVGRFSYVLLEIAFSIPEKVYVAEMRLTMKTECPNRIGISAPGKTDFGCLGFFPCRRFANFRA